MSCQKVNTSSELCVALYDCFVRPTMWPSFNEKWHNSNVSHRRPAFDSSPLEVGGPSVLKGAAGRTAGGPAPNTRGACVEQAPAGRDYCNLCHWLNRFPSLRDTRLRMESDHSVGDLASRWGLALWWGFGVFKNTGISTEVLPAVRVYGQGFSKEGH